MPKAPSFTPKSRPAGRPGPSFSSAAPTRSVPLAAQLKADDQTAKFGNISQVGRRQKKKGNRTADEETDDQDGPTASTSSKPFITGGKAGGGEKYVDKRLSAKILRLAREQQEEIELEEEEANGLRTAPMDGRLQHRSASGIMPDDDDEDGGVAGGYDMSDDDGELGDAASDEEEYEYEEVEVDPEDAALIERMRSDRLEADGPRATLADMIMQKIRDAGGDETTSGPARGQPDEDGMINGMNPKIVEVYTKVGELLSRYKSGPLPKAFKILPSLPHWEVVLSLTSPDRWTPHATLSATRIFVSNLKAAQSQRFFELVLRDKFRDEIEENKKTSYQIYEALKKGLYKPAAWFKGILFPLCESGTLTLKESAILSSVLTKVSIPMLHSAAALLRLSEMEYSGPNSLFIRVLLDKKYALPYKVVDSLVFHFLRFSVDGSGVEKIKDGPLAGTMRMPVLWHQSLLVFSQRYKQDLTPDQKTALLDLLRVQRHEGIGPEVRRELSTGKARGEMLDEPIDDEDDDSDAMSV